MYENKIITEPASLMKRIARDSLAGHWKQMFLAVFIYFIMTQYIADILDTIFARYETIELYGEQITQNVSFVGTVYTVLLTGAFSYGLALLLLTFFRTKKVDNKLIFEGFSLLGKSILLQLLICVKVALWSLLFVVPGIIAAINYSMSFYVLADHPDYGPMQCINESKRMMRGNKSQYLFMWLSFIGWYFVALLIEELVMAPFNQTQGAGVLIGEFIGMVPSVYLVVYIYVTRTVFYELLTGNLVVMRPDQEVVNQGVNPDNFVNADYQVHEDGYAGPDMGGYSEPNSGGYSESNSGGYEEPNSDGYAEPNSGSYEEPNAGSCEEPNAGGYEEPNAPEEPYRYGSGDEYRSVDEYRSGDEVDDFGGPKDDNEGDL